MREKTKRLVVTFHMTAEAMATEKLCGEKGLDGKLISAPRALSADCGLAWSAPAALRPEVEAALSAAEIEVAGYDELFL